MEKITRIYHCGETTQQYEYTVGSVIYKQNGYYYGVYIIHSIDNSNDSNILFKCYPVRSDTSIYKDITYIFNWIYCIPIETYISNELERINGLKQFVGLTLSND